jgi:hypothetical protein
MAPALDKRSPRWALFLICFYELLQDRFSRFHVLSFPLNSLFPRHNEGRHLVFARRCLGSIHLGAAEASRKFFALSWKKCVRRLLLGFVKFRAFNLPHIAVVGKSLFFHVRSSRAAPPWKWQNTSRR